MAEWTTEDGLVAFLDEWVDDLAPLNRGAFRPAARALLSRLAAHDAEVAAKALREGHREGYNTARGDLTSGAFIGGPTYETLRDSYSGRQIAKDALEEAASIAEGLDFGPAPAFSQPAAHKWGALKAAERIRARAAELTRDTPSR
jgi:hypothetical protein